MRSDAVGFFWNDAPVPKPPKPDSEKRKPPERTWERADYLPGLEEARRWSVPMFDEYALMSEIGTQLIFDVECYENYFEVGFTSFKTGRVMVFVMTPKYRLDIQRVRWICNNFTLVGFNSNYYDIPMLSFALDGHDNKTLKQVSDAIIVYEENPWQVLQAWKVKRIRCDHIDIREVCPLHGGLKAYGGRVACQKLQDLPFHPASWLTPDQMLVTTWYNVNDMTTTAYVLSYLKEPLALRDQLSYEYGIDLRSKSDAQIAEAVIAQQVGKINGSKPKAPEIPIGTVFWYNAPSYMKFQTPAMQEILDRVRKTPFVIGPNLRIEKPPQLEGLQVKIGEMVYTLGIGGLHSTEKRIANKAVGGYKIEDIDMESFYPRIVLNQRLYPPHLGEAFLQVFGQFVDRRVTAKRAGDKATANSLKITINGAYGKLGQPHSILYAPGLLTQVTLTGQLSILQLIEMFESYGIKVISANTDGIAIRYHTSQQSLKEAVLAMWSEMVSFKPEITPYLAMYNKDVNNYIAVKPDGKCKTKGMYANPWNDMKDVVEHLKKNPTAQIAVDAIEALFTKNIPVEQTILKSRDFTKFVTVRQVNKGGAVKNGEFLGKTIRWYYARGERGEIITANTGHTVPMSEGAKPCMTLPKEFPDDIDYDWYVQRAERHLKDMGYYG
jgi:hypothetical protein